MKFIFSNAGSSNYGSNFLRNWNGNPTNQRLQDQFYDDFLRESDTESFEENFEKSATFKAIQDVLARRGESHRLVKVTERPVSRGKIANNPYGSYVRGQVPY